MLEVSIKSISVTDIGFVVFFKTANRREVFPLFMGPVEAKSISLELMGRRSRRPMTHDLLKNVIGMTGYRLEKVQITEMRNETYFANLCLIKKGILKRLPREVIVDSRPSDAIALAIRCDCPIYISSELFDNNAIIFGEDNTEVKSSRNKKNKKTLEEMEFSKKENDELGVYKRLLDEAVKEERFEDASQIRDKIEILMKDDD